MKKSNLGSRGAFMAQPRKPATPAQIQHAANELAGPTELEKVPDEINSSIETIERERSKYTGESTRRGSMHKVVITEEFD